MLEFGPMQEASPTMRFMRLSSIRTEQIELARYEIGRVTWSRVLASYQSGTAPPAQPANHREHALCRDVGILRPTIAPILGFVRRQDFVVAPKVRIPPAQPPNPPLSLLRVGP